MKLLAALVLSVVLLLVACDGADEASTLRATVEATETAALTATPLATIRVPTPTATIVRQPPEFDGLTVGAPIDFPMGIELFTWDGCTSCDGPPSALVRVREIDGDFERTILRAPQSRRFIVDAWLEGDDLYVLECEEGNCGLTLDASPSTGHATLLGSADGGDTWTEIQAVGFVAETGEPILQREPPYSPSHSLSATGEYVLPNGLPVDLSVLDEGERYIIRRPLVRAGVTILDWSVVISEARGSSHRYISIFDDDAHRESHHVQANFSPTAWLDDGRMIGLAIYGRPPFGFDIRLLGAAAMEGLPGEAWLPSVFDVETGTLYPILQHFADRPMNHNGVIGVRFVE